VFVTGDSSGGQGFLQDYATVAYRASDGTQLWVARYNGPASQDDDAYAMSVARDSTAVLVTGISWENDNAGSMTTVAYRASDGAQLWVKSWGARGGYYYGTKIVSPGGNRVFVTGHVQSKAITAEYGTVAYNATTGARLWSRRYTGFGGTSIAVSPDLTKVYVTGTSHYDFTTLAYSARTGARLWVKRYGGRRSDDRAYSVAVSPRGTVIVTGSSRGFASSNADYATVAYSPGGAQLWAHRYSGPGDGYEVASAVAVPGNGKAYVTGTSLDDYATVAYNVRSGALVWVQRYNGPADGTDRATSLVARGGRVFVTGSSTGTGSGDDYATIAYKG
jgi:hypothetical protein